MLVVEVLMVVAATLLRRRMLQWCDEGVVRL